MHIWRKWKIRSFFKKENSQQGKKLNKLTKYSWKKIYYLEMMIGEKNGLYIKLLRLQWKNIEKKHTINLGNSRNALFCKIRVTACCWRPLNRCQNCWSWKNMASPCTTMSLQYANTPGMSAKIEVIFWKQLSFELNPKSIHS